MEQYTRDVEDFAFVPILKPGENESDARRLRIAIGISGWLDDKDDVVKPWKCVGPFQETFALRFELEALMNLGNALTTLVTSAAWSYAKSEIIKRTVFAALTAGLWPLGLLVCLQTLAANYCLVPLSSLVPPCLFVMRTTSTRLPPFSPNVKDHLQIIQEI